MFERERLPITEQVSHFAMGHAIARRRRRTPCPPNIEDPAGRRHCSRGIGKETYDLNVQQYCCAGLNFGYFYDASPIIAYDDEKAPAYTMARFIPSTVPGARVPHFWLAGGRSLYDALGAGYTLLRFDPSVDVSGSDRWRKPQKCRSTCST